MEHEVRDLDGGLVRTFGLPSGAANALVQDAGCALMPSPDGRGLGVISAFAGEPEQVRAFFSVEAPLHPPAILAVDLPNGEFELWNQRHVPFEATGGISATQVFAKDGDVRVPSLLLKPDTPGPMRTLLYGYGGFGTILYPSFRSHALAWVELGNAYVVANLRGGGEYGQEWHEDGKGLQKQHVFDDFAAVAQHLIATNVATSDRGFTGICDARTGVPLLVYRYDKYYWYTVGIEYTDWGTFPDLASSVPWVGACCA